MKFVIFMLNVNNFLERIYGCLVNVLTILKISSSMLFFLVKFFYIYIIDNL